MNKDFKSAPSFRSWLEEGSDDLFEITCCICGEQGVSWKFEGDSWCEYCLEIEYHHLMDDNDEYFENLIK